LNERVDVMSLDAVIALLIECWN